MNVERLRFAAFALAVLLGCRASFPELDRA
jgi:hypothetical protein